MKYSTESVSYQGYGLYDKLVSIIEEIKTGKSYSHDDIKKSGIEKVIFDKTGINVTLMLYKTKELNGWYRIPSIKPDHFFNTQDMMWLQSGYDAMHALSKMEVGYVDLENGRVDGFYSKIPIDITLTTGLIEQMDADITAAVLLHELGHAFTYFEYFNLSTYNGVVIAATSRALIGTSDKKRRKDIIKTASKLSGVDYYDNEVFAGKDDEANQAIMIRDFAAKRYNQISSNLYDVTNTEYVADEFAAKHGAALASAKFEKIIQRIVQFENFNIFAYVLFESASILMSIFALITIPINPIIYICWISLTFGEYLYEEPRDRVLAMRRNLIESIKEARDNPRYDREDLRRIHSDIEEMDKILDEMKVRPSIAKWLRNNLPFSQRGRASRDRKAYNMLQDILNNDLTYQASRFDTYTPTVK